MYIQFYNWVCYWIANNIIIKPYTASLLDPDGQRLNGIIAIKSMVDVPNGDDTPLP